MRAENLIRILRTTAYRDARWVRPFFGQKPMFLVSRRRRWTAQIFTHRFLKHKNITFLHTGNTQTFAAHLLRMSAQIFRQKYWIGAPKTRAKITIFQTPVFQLFISLLYRRTEEHILFSHRTHGMTQNWLHVFTRIYTEKFSREGAKGAEQFVLLFLCQKSLHTEITEIHRNFASHVVLRKSAPSAWDNSTPHGILWVPRIPCEPINH